MELCHADFLVEELSMEAFLRVLVPRLVPNLTYRLHPFRGKQDLLRQLPKRLRGYAPWIGQGYRIVVMVDRDEEDCHCLKATLEEHAHAAGLATRSQGHDAVTVVNRIVVPELEAWFFGDWEAVMAAYPGVPEQVPRQSRYRDPDAIEGGAWEALERILQRAGYFRSGYRKIEAAREIVEHMTPEKNRSHSFHSFRKTVLQLAREHVT